MSQHGENVAPVRKKVLRGTGRFTLKKIAQSILTTKNLEVTSADTVVQKADEFLFSTSRFMQFIYRIFLFLFEWGAFFFLNFERFSQLRPQARRRYINMWMNHKVGFVRNMFLLIRVLVISSFYDSKRSSSKIGFK